MLLLSIDNTGPSNNPNNLWSDYYYGSDIQQEIPPGGSNKRRIPTGGIIGITINAVLFVCIIVAIIWYRRRKRRRQSLQAGRATTTFPAEEPILPSEPKSNGPQELSSAEPFDAKHNSRRSWHLGNATSPPAYESPKKVRGKEMVTLQELPASTYIDEHHPTFGSSETATDKMPKTPTRSPVISATTSPNMSPRPDAHKLREAIPGVISPLGSPRPLRDTTTQNNAG